MDTISNPPFPKWVDPALIAKYSAPRPRYTSYPTAPHFKDGFSETDVISAHRRTVAAAAPLGLYMHLPFCRSLCTYCACHRKITQSRETIARYLTYLRNELALVGSWVGRPVQRIHWGGGTPTYLSADEVRHLMHAIRQEFDVLPNARLNIEADPRELSGSYMDTLADVGFRRVSFGVQAFDVAVQEAIGRVQSPALVGQAVKDARAAGFNRINFDLIYGLPHQTLATVDQTLEHVARMSPDSLSVFGYAHVPWMMKNQRLIPSDALPGPEERVALFLRLANGLQDAGYVPIGMDHFAKPGHPLVRGLQRGTIHRNFQGYTLHPSMEVLGFGVSAISQFPDAYSQQVKGFRSYYGALDEGRLPIARGLRLTREDRRRRHVINQLMCQMRIDKANIQPVLREPFDVHFADALEQLKPMAIDGLVQLNEHTIDVTPVGRVLIRSVAAAFDAYLKPAPSSPVPESRQPTARHSAAV